MKTHKNIEMKARNLLHWLRQLTGKWIHKIFILPQARKVQILLKLRFSKRMSFKYRYLFKWLQF